MTTQQTQTQTESTVIAVCPCCGRRCPQHVSTVNSHTVYVCDRCGSKHAGQVQP